MKVIRSGEKGFKEEKAKMEDWGIDGLIKNGGVMILNPEEVNKMPLTKKEQLEKSFKILLTTMLKEAKEECFIGDLIDSYANLLLKEVTIRTKL